MLGRRSLRVLLVACGLAAIVLNYVSEVDATTRGPNGRIVFRRYLDASHTTGALFTVNPDGTKVRPLLRARAGVIDTEPDWSPDGSKVAFERQVSCPAEGDMNGLNNTCDRIYTVRRNGAGLKEIVPCGFKVGMPYPGNCVGVDQPAWSPDGTKLAFQYNLVDPAYPGSYNVDGGIWTVNANGTDPRQVTQLTPGTSWDFGPQWSPDGTKLVFVRSDIVLESDAVFTVNVDGTGLVQLTPWELGGGNSPDWSPDGRWILFTAQPKDGSANVYKMHPDGTALTNLTNQGSDGYHYLSSSFSPNGKLITTARTLGVGPADVVVMRADGTKIRPVTRTTSWESGTDWGAAPLIR